MSGSIKVQGQELLQRALNSFALDLDKAVDDAVRITAIKVNTRAIDSIKEVSHGGVFKKKTKDGKLHEVSADGDAPNTEDGALIQSITFTHQRGAQLALVGTHLEYGAILETEKNRPWLEPAKMAEVGSFSDNMKQAIRIQVEKAGA